MPDVTDEELKTVVSILSKYQPGFLPFDLFLQIARLVMLPIYELVPLRNFNGQTEVLLLERDTDDPLWPGQLHIPGTVIRATDQSLNDAYNRIKHDELLGTALSSPVFVKDDLRKTKRGSEFAQIYWVKVTAEPKVGQFYSLDSLPDSLVEGQAHFIQAAAEHFKKHQF